MGIFKTFFKKKKEEIDFPPKPNWKPNLPIDLSVILETAKYYTGEKLQIAVFKNGTVIIFPNRVQDIPKEARTSLNKIYNSHPDFNPKLMDDGNYLIEYTQPAFTIVFKHEIDVNWDYINKNHLGGVCRDEVLINGKGEHNVFDKVGKICLFGRSKMFMDAETPEVALTFNY